jgi:hypothetical protein
MTKITRTKDEAVKELLAIQEPKFIATFPELRTEADKEYAQDRAAFTFECSVWGQFLRVSVARTANHAPTQRYASTALNLHNITQITLTEGHAPDYEGICEWAECSGSSTTDDDETRSYLEEPDYYGKMVEWRLGLYKQYQGVNSKYPNRRLFLEDEKQHNYYNQGYEIHARTPNVPRPAADDVIHFIGIGTNLSVPFGEGSRVLDRLLLATKESV